MRYEEPLRLADLFPTDRPVAADDMIGRATDVRELAGDLWEGTNVVLVAPRRSGKTSICDAALLRLRRRGAHACAVDLFARRDAADFAEGLILATIENRKPLARLADRLRAEAARDATAQTAISRYKEELGEELELAFTPGATRRDPERSLAYALSLPQRLAEVDGKRCVLFLDEFQEVAGPAAPYGDPDRFTKQLRAILQRSDRVTCVFAGSVDHLMRDLFAAPDRALAQFGSFRSLSAISRDDWRLGLEERAEQADCELLPEGLDAILEATGGHPRATMLVAREACRAARLQRRHDVGPIEVEAGMQSAMLADRLRHEQVLERIRLAKHAQLVAMRIARGQPPYRDLAGTQVQRALRALELAGLVEQPERRRWRISDPLLARFLASLPGTS